MIMAEIRINITGMSCNHCKMRIEKVLAQMARITSFTVSLEEGKADISGNPDVNLIIEKINKLGYNASLGA
jgi:copper chaperone CopZ